MTDVSDEDLEIVNVVGSGALGIEIDLDTFAEDIPEAEYNPANYHGTYPRISEDAPLVTLYRSGKYIITGERVIERSAESLFHLPLAESAGK